MSAKRLNAAGCSKVRLLRGRMRSERRPYRAPRRLAIIVARTRERCGTSFAPPPFERPMIVPMIRNSIVTLRSMALTIA
jgi:hypothetical protein